MLKNSNSSARNPNILEDKIENKNAKKFKFLEHTADIKFQAFGKNLEEVFKNSFLALKESICDKIIVKGKISREINIAGKDKEALLYNFLEEFLFLLDAENFLPSKIKKIKIVENKLSAKITGDSAENYRFTNKVKAITYNQMFLKKELKRWVIQVVLDV